MPEPATPTVPSSPTIPSTSSLPEPTEPVVPSSPTVPSILTIPSTSSLPEPIEPIPTNTPMNQPQENEPVLETRGDTTMPNQQELHVYSRKRISQGNKQIMNPTHSQEAEPVVEPHSPSVSGNLKNNPSPNLDLDVPIAIRKGIRSCSQHPISKFVSYSNLSPSFHAFTTNLSSVVIPRSIEEALTVPKWKVVVLEEMHALKQNNTWRLVELLQDKNIIRCKWVFTMKSKVDGSIERYKAQLVVKGFTQTYGIDYTKTFAPIAKLNTIQILLSLAANFNWPPYQLDVKNAFLNSAIEEVYMSQPPRRN